MPHTRRYIKGDMAQTRAYSPAVTTQGGTTVYLAGVTVSVDSNGKPLAGAALTSFMKKCTQDTCEPKAVDKNGKPLAGAAKASFMKKCQSDQS